MNFKFILLICVTISLGSSSPVNYPKDLVHRGVSAYRPVYRPILEGYQVRVRRVAPDYEAPPNHYASFVNRHKLVHVGPPGLPLYVPTNINPIIESRRPYVPPVVFRPNVYVPAAYNTVANLGLGSQKKEIPQDKIEPEEKGGEKKGPTY